MEQFTVEYLIDCIEQQSKLLDTSISLVRMKQTEKAIFYMTELSETMKDMVQYGKKD